MESNINIENKIFKTKFSLKHVYFNNLIFINDKYRINILRKLLFDS